MSANKRVYYACKKAGIAPCGSESYTTIHGLQTLGITTSFNLEQVFEVGQLSIYENIENIPAVEVTLEKVVDGYAPIYTLATQSPASSATLVGRSKGCCQLGVSIFADDVNSTSGTPLTNLMLSGLYVSSVGYSVTTDGNAKESVTLVGNDRVWTGTLTYGESDLDSDLDNPKAITGSGGVNRREDVIFGSIGNVTLLPSEIPGINTSNQNIRGDDNNYAAHVQRIDIRTNLGREESFELGRKGQFDRYVRFPVEVTTEIGILSVSGDMISASADGKYSEGGSCGTYNLTDQVIKLVMCEGLIVDCGTKNKLASVGITGGDAGGGNEEITYTYSNWNNMTVYHPDDPNWSVEGFSY